MEGLARRRIMIGLRLGDWANVLDDVNEADQCDVLLTDPPFSARTAKGYQSRKGCVLYGDIHRGIEYGSITEHDVQAFVLAWYQSVLSWVLIFADHVSWRWWERHWGAMGWYTFAPVVWAKSGAPPRYGGDGPTSACEYLLVARPKRKPLLTGSRPGLYNAVCQRAGHGGGERSGTKDVDALTRILIDYTRPGDLVVDPFAGTATVGAACKRTGRRYIGSEIDEPTYRAGLRRLTETESCPVGHEPDRWRGREQIKLFGGRKGA